MLSYVPVQPYEIVEHTADIGVRARGRSREELFAHMAMGMFSLIVPPEEIRSSQTVSVSVKADDWNALLMAWLKELLYLFDSRHFLGKAFKITCLEPHRLEAVVSGEPLDLKRHSADKEVKAVTYCDFQVQQDASGLWTAQVIFDI